MDLIIVESPSKAKTISKYLKGKYRVDASGGHIRDLPQKTLGVAVDKNFEPRYVTSPGKEETIKRLIEEAKKAGRVYLATDPDREGEAISWHLQSVLGLPEEGENRIEFNEISPRAVEHALQHPRRINYNLVDAQQARRVLDRLVGYKLSPLLNNKIRNGLSAGRVQSVALRLVVDREREIAALSIGLLLCMIGGFLSMSFTPQSMFTVEAAETALVGWGIGAENGEQYKYTGVNSMVGTLISWGKDNYTTDATKTVGSWYIDNNGYIVWGSNGNHNLPITYAVPKNSSLSKIQLIKAQNGASAVPDSLSTANGVSVKIDNGRRRARSVLYDRRKRAQHSGADGGRLGEGDRCGVALFQERSFTERTVRNGVVHCREGISQ